MVLEEEQEEHRLRNIRLLDQCLEDAKILAIKHGINTDENRAHLAIALFQQRTLNSSGNKNDNLK